ncbi:MAG: hypothetical protein AVDCRST_MAG59-3869 [uncultured Thermomicrobiales bacterium]|uniref:Uncharacterized protein n=1 Tax=uncultured Thermomicrobiales bacterium TaxID=1645740 RepID=A0A6J4VAK5_9BACT|nr:MAG: hypothetical protein AVDCRST_MAG59-3869 [uncultured Thermomicrobiales bacterium]
MTSTLGRLFPDGRAGDATTGAGPGRSRRRAGSGAAVPNALKAEVLRPMTVVALPLFAALVGLLNAHVP